MLVEEAGFDGIWASGFELSAACGLPDVSLVSMAEHLSTMRAIAQRTTLPIVADVDTGFGNAINILHTIEQYEDAGAAAVVIEEIVPVSEIFRLQKMDEVKANEKRFLR